MANGNGSCDLAILVLILGWLPLALSALWSAVVLLGVRRDLTDLDRTQRERWGLEDHGRLPPYRAPREGASHG